MTIKPLPQIEVCGRGFVIIYKKRKLIYFLLANALIPPATKKYRGDNNAGHKYNSVNIGIHADIGSPVRKIHGLYSDLSGAKN